MLSSKIKVFSNIIPSSKLIKFQSFNLLLADSSSFNACHVSTQANVSHIPIQYGSERQVWIENLESREGEKKGILDLHPDVWAVYPRLDIIHANLDWQSKYNVVNYNHVKNVKEMIYSYGGGAKPWPQKGTGRARQGSKRAPQWVNGGKVHGPKGPKSQYFMIPFSMRVYGLTHTLSVKLAQDDIHVVENLDIPTADPEFLYELVKCRGWGESVLFSDTDDIFPENITASTEEIPHMNVMPVYGLNVHSMIKHQTLILTERAVESLTNKLLFALNRTDGRERQKLNHEGPTELALKMEKYRPIV